MLKWAEGRYVTPHLKCGEGGEAERFMQEDKWNSTASAKVGS